MNSYEVVFNLVTGDKCEIVMETSETPEAMAMQFTKNRFVILGGNNTNTVNMEHVINFTITRIAPKVLSMVSNAKVLQ